LLFWRQGQAPSTKLQHPENNQNGSYGYAGQKIEDEDENDPSDFGATGEEKKGGTGEIGHVSGYLRIRRVNSAAVLLALFQDSAGQGCLEGFQKAGWSKTV
jgi:hypothetical protein